MKEAVLYWLVFINLIAFLTFGWDKWAAKKGRRRVPESRLLWMSFLFGAPGAWLGVRLFRHKTVKRSFRLRLYAVTFLQIGILGFGFWLYYK